MRHRTLWHLILLGFSILNFLKMFLRMKFWVGLWVKVNLAGVLGDHCKEPASVCEPLIHRLSMSFQLLEKIASLCALAAGSLKTKTEASMLFFQTISHKYHHFSSHITMPM